MARSRSLFASTLTVLLGVVGFSQTADAEGGGAECMHEVDPHVGRSASRSADEVVVYLNGNGGVIRGGFENASASRSSIVGSRGISSLRVPAYSSSAASWDSVVSCVQDQFSDFNVRIVERRPTSGRYMMAMVGGSPRMLGFPGNVGGVAPYSTRVIDNAVVFVFDQAIDSRRSQCEATAHEIGHALGLDHSTLCSDTMSYGHCGPKAFRDEAAACGEFGSRSCGSRAGTQNSHRLLARAVGVRSSRRPTPSRPSRPAPRPRPKPPVAQNPGTTNGNGRGGPDVRVLANREAFGNSVYVIQLQARDRDGIAAVNLHWANGRQRVKLRCGRTPRNMPVVCGRDGNTYTFALRVGRGDRSFAVSVTDGAGNTTVSKRRRVRLH